MKQTLLLLTVCLSSTLNVYAKETQPFRREDVFELEWVSDPQISPDGNRVVYIRNSMDIMSDSRNGRLWLIQANGSGDVPLTGRDTNERNPVWSPDGTRIAFTSDTDNGAEIFVYWLDAGRMARLTQLDRSPRGLSWSPDGRSIAFSKLVPEEPVVLVTPPAMPEGADWAEPPRVTTRLKYEEDGSGYIEPGYNHYFVVPASGGTARQVTQGDFQHNGTPLWAQDSRGLVFAGNRNENWESDSRNSEIYRVDLASGETVALTDRQGPDAGAVLSPDGKRIAYVGYDDKIQAYQVNRLYVMNLDGSGKTRIRVDLDRSISSLAWTRDGIWFQYDDKGDTRIAIAGLDGDYRNVASGVGGTTIGRPYGGGSYSVTDAGRIAFTHATAYRPAELVVSERRGRGHKVVTSHNADVLGRRELGQVEEVWYSSSTDGRKLQGWIVKPPGYDAGQEYPLLVENHGGPIANYGPWFSPEIQLYAAAGYIVFYPNPRGSTGYGEVFGNALQDDYPGNDYQDVMDGVDVLIERGLAQEGRLYVTGGSAGGIMTAWIVGKNKRFRAAAVVKPVMNWISKTLTADNYFMYAKYRYTGQPWENIEGYMRYSPVSLVGEIETPTLVMVGTADMRTPLSEAKQLYGALKIRGIDTALVEVPGAPHNIAGRPSQLIAKIDHVLAWFARYAANGP